VPGLIEGGVLLVLAVCGCCSRSCDPCCEGVVWSAEEYSRRTRVEKVPSLKKSEGLELMRVYYSLIECNYLYTKD